jgi:hypothetical protein
MANGDNWQTTIITNRLALNDITLALYNLENSRLIDQFANSGKPDEIFVLKYTSYFIA